MDEKQPFLLGGRDDGEVKRLTKEKRWNLRRKVGLFSLVLITFCFTIWKSGLPLVSLRNAETKGGESRRKASLDSWRWSEVCAVSKELRLSLFLRLSLSELG